jgi:hypothetical protein
VSQPAPLASLYLAAEWGAIGRSVYSCATLRYLLDAGREITVPVGVILCSPEEGKMWFRLPGDAERIAGVPLREARADLDLVRSQIEGWHRLGRLPYAKEPLEPLSVAWWEQVRGLLQWSVRLGPVQALAGGDPEAVLEALYERTVEPQPAGRERLQRLEAAVERVLGSDLSGRFQRHRAVPGFGGRPVPVLRLAADDRRASERSGSRWAIWRPRKSGPERRGCGRGSSTWLARRFSTWRRKPRRSTPRRRLPWPTMLPPAALPPRSPPRRPEVAR